MTTTIFPRCPHCRETMSPMDHGRCTHCGKLCGCSFAPESMSDYCDSHRPAPRREDAAGADEETPIRLAIRELLDAIALHPRGSTMTRHAIDKIVDLHIDALDESRAALSTAEREREAAQSRLDFIRDTCVVYYHAPDGSRRELENINDLDKLWAAEVEFFASRVPSGGEEGR